MKHLKPFKSAFTMIELLFVIVVLGIIASLAIPRLDRDLKQEAADTILSNIRYTQHLALNDDKHLYNNPKWQQRLWRIVFSTCSGGDKYFMVGADNSMTGASNATFSKPEAAIDPTNGKPLFWKNTDSCSDGGDSSVSENIFLSHKFGVTIVAKSGGCANAAHIAFDHLGRPFNGASFTQSTASDSTGYIKTACIFTFTMSDSDTFSITIEPETGNAYINGQGSS